MASYMRPVPRQKVHPEEGSIHAILVANPSKRLYAHLIEWTPEHLDLLSCELHPLMSWFGREAEKKYVQMEISLVLHGI
jgi:hypothetical protein